MHDGRGLRHGQRVRVPHEQPPRAQAGEGDLLVVRLCALAGELLRKVGRVAERPLALRRVAVSLLFQDLPNIPLDLCCNEYYIPKR